MEAGIPEEVRQFVEKYITTLDQLEVLLLVTALPDREWTVGDLDNIVRTSFAIVRERLEGLVSAGILAKSGEPGTYRYQPKTNEMAQAISALGATYKSSRHRIVELIYSPTRAKEPLTSFSDAFRFRKKDEP